MINSINLLFICKYIIIDINILIKIFFCILVYLVQIFCFEKISFIFKTCLFVIKNYTNLYFANINICVFYNKKEKATILLTIINRTILFFNILKSNNYIYNKFIIIVAKNEVVYIIATKLKK